MNNLDYFVSFVEGKFIDRDKNLNSLLKRVREKHPNNPRFYKKVEINESYVKISTPISIITI